MEKVLKKIKFYVKERGLTIYKLTELTDLSENTIYNWYNKGAEPSIHALRTICKVLDVSMSELFSDDDEVKLTFKEKKLISNYQKLSDTQKELMLKISDELSK